MWRSFFLALGIFSIILGAQSLVVEHFMTADTRKFPRLIYPENGQGGYLQQSPLQQSSGYNPYQNSLYQRENSYGLYSNFDPALQDNRFGNRPLFQQASYGNAGYGQAGFFQGRPTSFRNRIIYTKDWMPWSLIAVGSVIVLYTTSLRRKSDVE
ncbi:MAG: hypothetical protein AAF456_06725 [Planctomycetota bacterium]